MTEHCERMAADGWPCDCEECLRTLEELAEGCPVQQALSELDDALTWPRLDRCLLKRLAHRLRFLHEGPGPDDGAKIGARWLIN